MPTLWHASEDPHIEIFRPHRARTAQLDEPLVWAIDDEHVPAYWFPRDCPRATFWVTERTSEEDRAWLHGVARVHAIECDWWERFRDPRGYLYLMPPELCPLWDRVIRSTLGFSSIRLRNTGARAVL